MNTKYLAYMLRLQRGDRQSHWRATLEDAYTGELHRFPSERELLLFLMRTLSDEPPNSFETQPPGDP